jgi:hypothetical protein
MVSSGFLVRQKVIFASEERKSVLDFTVNAVEQSLTNAKTLNEI